MKQNVYCGITNKATLIMFACRVLHLVGPAVDFELTATPSFD
jgi:hypothetical protein